MWAFPLNLSFLGWIGAESVDKPIVQTEVGGNPHTRREVKIDKDKKIVPPIGSTQLKSVLLDSSKKTSCTPSRPQEDKRRKRRWEHTRFGDKNGMPGHLINRGRRNPGRESSDRDRSEHRSAEIPRKRERKKRVGRNWSQRSGSAKSMRGLEVRGELRQLEDEEAA